MISDEPGSAGLDFLWQTELFLNSSPSFTFSFISASPRDEEEDDRDEDEGGDSTQNQPLLKMSPWKKTQ